VLSLNIGEIGQPITITGVGCGSNSTIPSNFQAASATISSGQVASLTASCPVSSATTGSRFSGQVWIQYYYNSNPSATYSVVVANVKTSVTSGGVPGGYVGYVPITIFGNPTMGTGPNFQQMVYFNPTQSLAYTANEASDLGNIRFYQGGTELYSWCESGCNDITSTNAVFWVKLPLGISAGANVVVNMTFLSNTVEYDGVYAGEWPLATPTYAQYDNGQNVFVDYYNMKTNPIASAINSLVYTVTSTAGPTGASQPVLYGTIPSGSSNFDYAALTPSSVSFPKNVIVSEWIKAVGGWHDAAGITSSSNYFGGYFVDTYYTSSNFRIYSSAGGGGSGFASLATGTAPTQTASWVNAELDYVSGGSMTAYTTGSWVNQITSTGLSSLSTTDSTWSSFNSIFLATYQSTGYTDWAHIVARSYPPGGVMPTATFGSFSP
jgi:hypothetical protein